MEHPACECHGDEATVFNIRRKTCCNTDFRKVLWTGCHLQVTVMYIPCGGEIGLECHTVDQLIHVESGCAKVYMGQNESCVKLADYAESGSAILVPAGTWHNVVNDGIVPLKVFSVYAPPQHPAGTVHHTKAEADTAHD